MKVIRAALLGAALSMIALGSASAAPCSGANIYNNLNGTTTFPGTNVGTVGNGPTEICQIGDLSAPSQGNAVVSPDHTPSIYEFYFAGGNLRIDEQLGNNGTLTPPNFDGVYIKLFSLDSIGDTTPTQFGSETHIPFTSGPSYVYNLYNGFLASGYYAISNSATEDPRFEIIFTSTPGTPAPEPATLALVGGALAGFGSLRRRRAKKQ